MPIKTGCASSFGCFLGRLVKMPSTTKTVNLRAFSLHNPKNPRKTVPLEFRAGQAKRHGVFGACPDTKK